MLCNVSHLIFPWLKSPNIIQSPLLTSLIALCIFSLFCLVMLGQRYTTPMVTVVCPVTNLHHMVGMRSDLDGGRLLSFLDVDDTVGFNKI